MKRTINLAKRNALDLERDGLSQLSRDAIERRREPVVLREIIVIDSSGKAVPNEP